MTDPDPSLVFSGLLPHPPIAIPPVAGPRADACAATTEACRDLARRFVAAKPDRLFLISPHSPRREGLFGVWDGDRVRGNLAQFRAEEVAVDFPADSALIMRLLDVGRGRVAPIPPQPLDHGATVPLWFLAEAGWSGPTCVVSLPWHSRGRIRGAFAQSLRTSLAMVGGTTAICASGDMSHRVLPNSPAGHDPQGLVFDEQVCACIEERALERVASIDPDLRLAAAEDVVDSVALAAMMGPAEPRGVESLSYEHPFGVGYLVAVLHDPEASPQPDAGGAV